MERNSVTARLGTSSGLLGYGGPPFCAATDCTNPLKHGGSVLVTVLHG
jgi:hypothetical protein